MTRILLVVVAALGLGSLWFLPVTQPPVLSTKKPLKTGYYALSTSQPISGCQPWRIELHPHGTALGPFDTLLEAYLQLNQCAHPTIFNHLVYISPSPLSSLEKKA